MLSAILPDDQEDSDTPEQARIRQSMPTPPNVEDTPDFQLHELAAAVKKLTKGKCPGPDLIEVVAIQRAWGGLQ
jgi:hypothetical protein